MSKLALGIFLQWIIFPLYMQQIYSNKQQKLVCAIIDYKKAFGNIARISLWIKFIYCGINDSIFMVIYNLYAGAKSSLKMNGILFDYFKCKI